MHTPRKSGWASRVAVVLMSAIGLLIFGRTLVSGFVLDTSHTGEVGQRRHRTGAANVLKDSE